MDDLKTLAEIWESAGRKPVNVLDTRYDVVNLLVGVYSDAAVIIQDDIISRTDCTLRAWKLHKERKIVEH
jgi:hypothetical protein